MADSGSMYITLGLNMRGVTQSLNALGTQIKNLNKEVQALKGQMKELEGATSGVGDRLRRGKKPIDESVTSLKKMESSLAMTAQRFRTFGYLASAMITAPMVLMSKSIIKTAADFEYSMDKIVGLVGIARGQMEKWKEEVLKMGPEVARTPQELAEALYFVSSSGFKTAEALKITRISAQAATAGLGSTVEVANFLTSALNAYSGTGLTVEKATDQLVAGVREGKIEAQGFASAIQQVIPIASAMGVSLGQVIGSMAAMSLQGANASNSAVYLKGILNSLLKIKPTNEAGKALAELGSSALQLRKMLASGPNGLMDVLLKIQGWAESNPYLLNKVFGNIRALTGDLSLTGKNLRDNQRVISIVVNAYGDLSTAVQAVSGDMKVRMDSALSKLKVSTIELGTAIGKYLIPLLEGVVKLVAGLIHWFSGWGEGAKKIVIALATIAAALGPLSLMVSLHLYIVAGVVKIYEKLKTTGTSVVSFLTSAKAPWIALAVAIGAVILGIGHLIREHNELKRVYKETEREVNAERFSLNSLFTALKNSAEGTKARKDAIAEINSRYSTYIGYILTEENALKKLKEAQEKATAALSADIRIRNYKAKQEDLFKEVGAAEERYMGGIMNKWSKIFGSDRIGEFTKGLDDAVSEASASMMNRALTGAQQDKGVLDAFNKFYKEFITDMGVEKRMPQQVTIYDRFLVYLQKFTEKKRKLDELSSKIEAFGGTKTVLTLDELGRASAVYGENLRVIGKLMGGMTGMIFQNIGSTFTNMGKSLGFTNENLNDFNETAETVDSVLKDLKSEIEGLKVMEQVSKAIGKPFDLAKESAERYLSAIEKLTGPGPQFRMDISDPRLAPLIQALKNLNVDWGKTEEKEKKFFKSLNADLASVDMKRMFPSLQFDENLAKLNIYKKALDTYLELLMSNQTPEGILVVPDPSQIKNVNDYVAAITKYTERVQKAEDARMLYVLNAEADAFGGLAGKIEVVNYALEATERTLRNMFMAKKEMKVPIDPKKVKELTDQIKYLKTVQIDLKGSIDATYFEDINKAVHSSGTETALWANKISELEIKLRDLSKNGQGKTPVFEYLSKQYRALAVVGTDAAGYINDAFDQLFDALLDGGKNMGDVFKNIFKAILADIVKTVAHAMILKAVMKSREMKPGSGGGGGGFQGQGMNIASGIISVIPLLKILKGVVPGFAKGGIVPYGHLDDSFPAMLTSREFVIPEEKLDALLKESPNAKHLKKQLTDQLPKLQGGGVIPKGYPNDTYPALLTSGEIVVPPIKLPAGGDYVVKLIERLDKLISITVTGNKDLLSKGWLEGKTSPLKIADKRITDLITGQPVKDTGRLGGEVDPKFVAEVVQKSMQRGMDPYLPLAISHQETGGFKKDYMDNPFSILWPNPEELAKYDLDPIGYSLDFIAEKLKLADKLGKKTFAEQVQFFNGTGRIMPDTFGRPMKKVYGVDIPPEGISMRENPLYGKRVEDIKNNILLKNDDLVRLVDSIKGQGLDMVGNPLPEGKARGPMISNPEDLMSLNTTLSQTAKSYELATQGATAFGTALKVTEPMIQAQTTALEKTNTIKKDNPLLSPVPIPKIPTLGTPNRLLENGLAPPPVMPTGSDAAQQIASLISNMMTKLQQPTGRPMARGNKNAAMLRDTLMSTLMGFVAGGPFGAILGGLSGLTGFLGMAQGGIIPPGYPNDTYPAMLSSHEAVIPLDKLNKQDNYEFEPVVFEIAGDRLEGILRKRVKKTSTY